MQKALVSRAEAELTYKTLTALVDPAPWAIPSCIINYSESEVDGSDQLHGFGCVSTSMGFSYEGNLCHGQMEGPGVIHWADGYTVRGNFNQGAVNGPGRLTWANGDCYEGELVNSIRQGTGKLTSHRGRAVYEGGWARGRRNGHGQQRFPDGDVYIGSWLDDQRHGQGVMMYSNGDAYEGEWVGDEPHGMGEMGWKKGTLQYLELYEGMWQHGLPSGQGRATTITYHHTCDVALYNFMSEEPGFVTPSKFPISIECSINVYEGNFVDGTRAGKGTFYYADGSRFEGWWEQGKKTGVGKFIPAIKKAFYANFIDDAPQNLPPLPIPGCENVVPSIHIEDLCTIVDESGEQVVAAVKAILLRFNTWMKSLFHRCCCSQDKVALITTPETWWKHRLPGLVSMPQLLRYLNDAHILDGVVTLSTVISCVVDTIQAEQTDNHALKNPETVSSEESRYKSLFIEDVFALRANLNYRQFTEVLVRLANVVVVGPSFVSMGLKLSNLIEERLSRPNSVNPLFPTTRAYAADVKQHLSSLKDLFHALVEMEHFEPERRFVSVRFLMRFLRPLLFKNGLELRQTISELFPLRARYYRTPPAGPSSLPSGFNMPQSDFGYELFAKASGDAGELDADAVTDSELALEDFVEAVVLTALKCCNDANGRRRSVAAVIESEVLSLRVYDM